MIFTPIVGTLVYVVDDTPVDPSEHQVLMVHRIARKDDDHLGKYNGLGGKLESGEDVVAGARREIREEAGIELDEITLRGTVVWTGFGPSQENWLGFIFIGRTSSPEVPPSNDEGDLLWVAQRRLLSACDEDPSIRDAAELPMWEGDRLFLPLVFDTNPVPFHGAMAYEGDRPSDWSYSR